MSDLFDRVKKALADRYAIEREVGSGGAATVYLAQDLKHHRPVAVKVLRPDVAATLGAKRFLHEIEIAAQLQHPHILPLYDSGEVEGFLFFVMPYARGESLRDRIVGKGELPIGEVVRLLREIADALSHAHQEGVVHRDIKPDNVMVSGSHAMVTDFGVAKAVSEATGRTQATTTAGVALGTPSYMAPEQATADPHIDHRVDIYALGAMAYELLTGRPPFVGNSVQAVLSAHVTATPQPVSDLRPSIPPALAQLVMRCLEKNPADRWQSSEEVVRLLDALVTPVHGSMPVPAVPGARRKSVTRWWVPVAVAIPLILFVGVWRPWRASETVGAAAVGDSKASVAVLPFRAIGSEAAALGVDQALTEEIQGQLVQVSELSVRAHTSVVALSGSNLTLPRIADTLGVDHVVDGTVQVIGDQVYVSASLIEAHSDVHLWSEPFTGQVDNLLEVQQEIAQQVVGALVSTVVGLRPVSPTSRTDPAAYEAYLRGKQSIHRRTRDALETAIAAFERTLELDPDYAPAYAGLASAYGLWVTYAYSGELDGFELYARSHVMANRAIDLDSGLAEAYAARAYSATKAFYPADGIAADFVRALDLAPNSADVVGWYAHLLAREGQFDSALALAEAAIALDPLAPGRRTGFAFDALAARRHDLAAFEAQQALTLEPTLTVPKTLGALAHLLMDQPEQCAELARGGSPAVMAMCLHSQGETVEAARIVDSIRTAVEEGIRTTETSQRAIWIPFRDLATYHAWTGDVERALSWLDRAFARSPNAVDFRIIESGIFDKVLADTRFRTGLENIRREVRNRVQRERRAFAEQAGR